MTIRRTLGIALTLCGSVAIATLTLAGALPIASANADEGAEVPAAVEPGPINARGSTTRHTVEGHGFNFSVNVSDCLGPGLRLDHTTLIERPENADHVKVAIVTAYMLHPAHTESRVCAPSRTTRLHRIRTKRPAADLIFFDGSSSPPRRIWPLAKPNRSHRRSGPPPTAASPAKALAPAAATGAFGLDLLRTQPPGNAVLSPDSVGAALAMTGTGAAGSTAAEIARTLHLKGPSVFPAVGDLQRTIVAGQAAAAAGDPEAPTLAIADGLFLQQGLPFEPAFLSGAQQHFGAAPETVDFRGDPTGALEAINGWVSEHTQGLIPWILESLPAEMALALANAVYLKADWEHPFEQRDTRPGVFHRAVGKSSVEFMHETESLPYGAGPGYRAVALPYRSSTLSLLVVLPVGQPLGSLQHRLDGRALARIARGLSARPVILSLPRFNLKTDVELTEALEKLGMSTAFSEGADFSRITSAVPLKIAFVKHAADFTVDEKGTVAAAATVTGVVAMSGPAIPRNAVTFNANRPFLFFLRDDRTGAVLFAGRLTNPASAAP